MRGEKLGEDLWIDQPVCYGCCREPSFSGVVSLLNAVDDYTKGCYTRIMRDMYCQGPYADRAWNACGLLIRFSLQGVHQFVCITREKLSLSMTTLAFKVSGEVMANFFQNPDLCRKVKSAQISSI
jgi:hypothetical protein